MAERSKAMVRRAEFSDCQQVEALLDSFGLGVAEEPEGVRRWWEWMWQRNPALTTGRRPQPRPGWVLEAGGEIVGFFGNLPARYQLGDEVLLAAVGSHWAVQKPFRIRVKELAAAYFGQDEADLLVATTCNRATGRIYDRFAASPMPYRDYQRVLYWVLDPVGFLRSAFRKKGVHPGVSRIGQLVLGPALASAMALQKRRPGRLRPGIEPEAISVDAVGDEFDDLWRRKVAEGCRLYACRTAADLRWHFEFTSAEAVIVLRCRRRGGLQGYLVLVRETVPEIGLDRLKVADLFVASNNLDTIDALLAAAYEMGRALGCHVLELVGFPREIRTQAERFRPFSRLYPTYPFYFKARSADLHRALHSQDVWYPSLYDGDGCLG